MEQVCLRLLSQADAVVAAAAVSDFRPKVALEQKAHKETLGLMWEMERTPDVVRAMVANKRPATRVIGFAAETDNLVQSGQRKLREKGLDWVVANAVGRDQGFSDWPYRATIIGQEGVEVIVEGKAEAAAAILDRLVSIKAEG
jgi:phosphopantothenoylcysteine decarboxylase/phosphopantothenate--cysteine ligase